MYIFVMLLPAEVSKTFEEWQCVDPDQASDLGLHCLFKPDRVYRNQPK